MRLRRASWLVVSMVLSAVARVPAALPEVEVAVDTACVALGDPVQLTMRLRHRPDEEPALPRVSEWLQGVSARPGEQTGPVLVDGEMETVLRYELRFYELGMRQIPPLPVSFIQASGDTLFRTSRPLDIEVVSVREEGDVELRDIKPPMEIPGGLPLWLAGMLGALGVVLVVAGVFWLLDRRKRGPEEEPLPPPVDYAAEFVRIAGMGLLERGDFKTYYTLLSENLRRYLEASLQVEAMEQTTAEIRRTLNQVELDSAIVEEVVQFLSAADLVKFARFIPELAQARRVPETGMALVRALEAEKKKKVQPVLEQVEEQPVS